MKRTIGGDRLGSGKKMQVDLKGYQRSTHDRGYLWRSTMAAGTLVPFMKQVALMADTFNIDLNVDVKTHPTIGPLFGSYKVQLDIFTVPFRLYQSGLHNNATEIGLRMGEIKLPQLRVQSVTIDPTVDLKTLSTNDMERMQHEPSSLLSYLGINGAFISRLPYEGYGLRDFNAIPYIGYYDIYKNYYANKQEKIGMFINAVQISPTSATVRIGATTTAIPAEPAEQNNPLPLNEIEEARFNYNTPAASEALASALYLGVKMPGGGVNFLKLTTHFQNIEFVDMNGFWQLRATNPRATTITDEVVNYRAVNSPENIGIQISEFPLEHIDQMREMILAAPKFDQFVISGGLDLTPYSTNLVHVPQVIDKMVLTRSHFSQQGLALKTYQSDLFNNWMDTEWIDDTSTGINAITAVEIVDDKFTIDQLNLASKIFYMLNRVAITGGTYKDWLETVYDHDYINRAEIPVYQGGLSKELVFQEVVSTAESADGEQPLATLGGKGVMSNKHKGGRIAVTVDEPSYIMGIVSITPRIDYSQGNDWDVNLKTMNDLHKPALDEIGFQDLITEQMAWWTTDVPAEGVVSQKSAGKQPAWINYMTEVNKVKGNFAKRNDQMFMTLNRRYEFLPVPTGAEDGSVTFAIGDLTTYIDPSKFNFVFAQTDLTSQNFWVNISADITARIKMSAKIMPNL